MEFRRLVSRRYKPIEQRVTSRGCPRCLNPDCETPLYTRNIPGMLSLRNRFCDRKCATEFAHYILDNMPDAKLWSPPEE